MVETYIQTLEARIVLGMCMLSDSDQRKCMSAASIMAQSELLELACSEEPKSIQKH